MKKSNKTMLEINNLSYIEKPHAILKCILAGFSIEEIQINKINACRYNIVAIKIN